MLTRNRVDSLLLVRPKLKGIPEMTITSDLLTTPEACELLRVCRATLYKLAALKRISKRRVASKRGVRWSRKELERYVEQSSRKRR